MVYISNVVSPSFPPCHPTSTPSSSSYDIVDRPTELICIYDIYLSTFICQHTNSKDIAGQCLHLQCGVPKLSALSPNSISTSSSSYIFICHSRAMFTSPTWCPQRVPNISWCPQAFRLVTSVHIPLFLLIWRILSSYSCCCIAALICQIWVRCM